MRRCFFVSIALFLITTTSVQSEENIEWTTSTSGGSLIDIPVFMTDGFVRALMMNGDDYGTAFEPERFPVQLRQYRTDHRGKPYSYLQLGLGNMADEVTYKLDRDQLAAISGFTNDRKEIFYGMCKRRKSGSVCFDMHYPKELQATFGPIVTRIADSFKKGR